MHLFVVTASSYLLRASYDHLRYHFASARTFLIKKSWYAYEYITLHCHLVKYRLSACLVFITGFFVQAAPVQIGFFSILNGVEKTRIDDHQTSSCD